MNTMEQANEMVNTLETGGAVVSTVTIKLEYSDCIEVEFNIHDRDATLTYNNSTDLWNISLNAPNWEAYVGSHAFTVDSMAEFCRSNYVRVSS